MTTTQYDPTLAAPVLFDIYPATVLSPEGAVAHTKVRVLGTPSWLVVYGEGAEANGRLVAKTVRRISNAGARPHPRSAGAWIVTDAEGREWTVTRGSGCGCGSPLRHLPSPAPLDL